MTAGIMCLALTNRAAAQSAAGTGAGGVVISGMAIGAAPLAIGAFVVVAAMTGGGSSASKTTN